MNKLAKTGDQSLLLQLRTSLGIGSFAKWVIQNAIKDKNSQSKAIERVVIEPKKLKEKSIEEQKLYNKIQEAKGIIYGEINKTSTSVEDNLKYIKTISNIYGLCNTYLEENAFSHLPEVEVRSHREKVKKLINNLDELDSKKIYDVDNLNENFKIDYTNDRIVNN